MTFSIVAIDAATGELGVATASRFLAVGSVVPWARAGVGAAATQSLANVAWGTDSLDALAAGSSAPYTVDLLAGTDPLRHHRQLGLVDARGGAGTWTGGACMDWAGGRTAEGVAAQGNILTGPDVVDALLDAFASARGPLADRLLAALSAGDAQGGDRRGRQSAALLVVREGGGYLGGNDRYLDLRVDDHPDPVTELSRLRGLHGLIWDRPDEADLLPIDEDLAAELRRRLSRLVTQAETPGSAPDEDPALTALIPAAVGAPRALPAGWDDAWQARLVQWMGIENLELRIAAPGWLDPVVLRHVRAMTDS